MVSHQILRIGISSWVIPLALRENFPCGDSLLERYSQVFNIVEINSSFYRSHAKKTYARWAAVTPENFIFAVKMPQEITHRRCLVDSEGPLSQFIDEVSMLQGKLGPILIQLPPSLNFNLEVSYTFFKLLRTKFVGNIALEARHSSWSNSQAVSVLMENDIVQVIADPAVIEIKTNKDQLFKYYRLHGSPRIYSSSYQTSFLDNLSKVIDHTSIVIFDNTKLGAAAYNALDLKKIVHSII